MLGAWPQVSLCVRAGRRFGVLLLGAAEPRWTMRYPAMSCWLLQGPALRLAVSWYALLGPPVHTAGAGVGLAWRGPPPAWCVVKIKNRRCAARLHRFAPLRRPAPPKLHGLGTLGTCRVPLGERLFSTTPRLEPAALPSPQGFRQPHAGFRCILLDPATLGSLVLGAAEASWTMRCLAMSWWLHQGPAARIAVSWYALLGPPVHLSLIHI